MDFANDTENALIQATDGLTQEEPDLLPIALRHMSRWKQAPAGSGSVLRNRLYQSFEDSSARWQRRNRYATMPCAWPDSLPPMP